MATTPRKSGLVLPGDGMAFGMEWGEFLQKLRNELQLDASTDLLANSLRVPAGTWIAPTLVNAWANAGGTIPVGYLKDSLGFVHLRGRILGGAVGSISFTLPPEYRPAGNDTYAAAGYRGAAPWAMAAWLNILANGTVTMFWDTTAAFGDIGMGGISFLAEN